MTDSVWMDLPLLDQKVVVPVPYINMVIDKSMGLNETADFVSVCGPFVRQVKLGFGTAGFWTSTLLKKKLELLSAADILCYPGGTLFEFNYCKNGAQNYGERLQEAGFRGVEISDGSCELPQKDRARAIERSKKLGLTVLSEIGKKDPQKQLPIDQVIQQIHWDFESGSDWVIFEARESGKGVGLFDAQGEVRMDLFESLVVRLRPADLPRLIWEAPQKSQQVFLMQQFGSQVHLGNLQKDELLAVESLRKNVRWETFRERS